MTKHEQGEYQAPARHNPLVIPAGTGDSAASENATGTVVGPERAIAIAVRWLRTSAAAMVEGHSVHRVCHAHRAKLVGKSFTASSPNGCEPNAMPDGVVLPCSRLLSICYYITHVFPVTPGVTGKKIARNTATEVGPTW